MTLEKFLYGHDRDWWSFKFMPSFWVRPQSAECGPDSEGSDERGCKYGMNKKHSFPSPP